MDVSWHYIAIRRPDFRSSPDSEVNRIADRRNQGFFSGIESGDLTPSACQLDSCRAS